LKNPAWISDVLAGPKRPVLFQVYFAGTLRESLMADGLAGHRCRRQNRPGVGILHHALQMYRVRNGR